MARKSSKARRQLEQIDELEIKRRSGLVRVLAAIVVFVVVTAVKESCVAAGIALASDMVVNILFYILALVLAGVAGLGSRDYMRASSAINDIKAKMK